MLLHWAFGSTEINSITLDGNYLFTCLNRILEKYIHHKDSTKVEVIRKPSGLGVGCSHEEGNFWAKCLSRESMFLTEQYTNIRGYNLHVVSGYWKQLIILSIISMLRNKDGRIEETGSWPFRKLRLVYYLIKEKETLKSLNPESDTIRLIKGGSWTKWLLHFYLAIQFFDFCLGPLL